MAGREWVQFHTPDRMGYGIDECGANEREGESSEFSLVTSRDCGSHVPLADVAWVVGKTQDKDGLVYLGWWFIVDDIVSPLNPDFLYKLVGKRGERCDPMPVISGEPWYQKLQGMTGNFKFGFTEINNRAVLSGLRASAASVGCPVPP
jgi:hypothetical protein